jgi:c-di-GMP-binding flagellar brake protein YcgR
MVVFGSPIQRRETGHRINATTAVEAICLSFPSEIKAIQRRNNYRVRIMPGDELSVRTWRIAEQAPLRDLPMHAQEVACELHDLSLSGMGVLFRGECGGPPRISTEDRLRIELSHGGKQMLLEGRVRHPTRQPKQSSVRAGVQFKALEEDLEGRQTLARLSRILGELQREEARRFRLGLSKAS